MNNKPKLTDKQRNFAVEHHELVYKFLNKKKLDTNTYYDIVVPGYLRAVVNYFDRDDLKQYRFSTIAWRAMNSDLYNYYRYLNRKKRKADVISFDYEYLQNPGFSLLDMLASPVNPEQEMEDKLFWLEVYSLLNESQIELIKMRLAGYSKRDISRKFKIPFVEVDTSLLGIWNGVKVLFGNEAINKTKGVS